MDDQKEKELATLKLEPQRLYLAPVPMARGSTTNFNTTTTSNLGNTIEQKSHTGH